MTNTLHSQELGQQGEQTAQQWCTQQHYVVIGHNVHLAGVRGEVDIIAWDTRQGELVFLEVKTRSGHDAGWPEEHISSTKAATIRTLAARWLQLAHSPESPHYPLVAARPPVRFDVLSLTGNAVRGFLITHFEAAF